MRTLRADYIKLLLFVRDRARPRVARINVISRLVPDRTLSRRVIITYYIIHYNTSSYYINDNILRVCRARIKPRDDGNYNKRFAVNGVYKLVKHAFICIRVTYDSTRR